ncbi:MAG: Ig-like domain-containing protein, partial [Saprospiraceae bacterium]|nr:Ig-like domain-containing protein [Saprospiraceae bacterium]
MPQTIGNGLKPYGMVYDLIRNQRIPVFWSRDQSKAKDGVDFTYNGTSYRGGPFIITAGFRSAAVNAVIAAWEAQGVIGVTTNQAILIPVCDTIQHVPIWTLDQQNGSIAEKYLLRAGIPSDAYNWKLPSELDCCIDLFAMPHADPEWGTHGNLYVWNSDCQGSIWAACHAVSALENTFNPSNPSQQLNFLSDTVTIADPADEPWGDNSLVLWGDHNDGTLPPSYQYALSSHPVMQFMSLLDGATQNGSEQIYLPKLGGGWRSSTNIGVWDHDHPQANPGASQISPGEAAVLAFGQGYGDNMRGRVMYEGGHSHEGSSPANVAAMRAFFNFSWWAAEIRKISVTGNIPNLLVANELNGVSATASGGTGNFSFEWSATCPGTFENINESVTTFVPAVPDPAVPTQCIITISVTDDCGTRFGFASQDVKILPPPLPPDAQNDEVTIMPDSTVVVDVAANDSDPNLDSLIFSLRDSPNDTLVTSNGKFINNQNGTITYVPNPSFEGTDTAFYVVCDTTPDGPPHFGPFCDTAYLAINVVNLDENGCQIGLQSYVFIGRGFADTVIISNDIGGEGPDGTLGVPNGKEGQFNDNNDSLIVDLRDTISGLDTVLVYLKEIEGDAQIEISSSLDAVIFSNTLTFTNPANLSLGLDTIVYLTPPGNDFRYLKIVNTRKSGASENQDFEVDGIEYDRFDCIDCNTFDSLQIVSGNAEFVSIDKSIDDESHIIGVPDGLNGAKLNNSTDTLIVRLEDTIPAGNQVYIYLASDNSDFPATVRVSGSLDSLSFSHSLKFSAYVDKGDAFIQFAYPINQMEGIKYLLFDSAGVSPGDIRIDAVEYVAFECLAFDPPTANNDTVEAIYNSTSTIPVQSNDVDNSGRGLITRFPASNGPSQGSAIINGNQIDYTPSENFTGQDSFQYIVCDQVDTMLCDTAWVFISVPNSAPLAIDDVDSINLCYPVIIQVSSNDSDNEGNQFSVVEIVRSPVYGTASITFDSLKISYDPDDGYLGGIPDTLEYRICDDDYPAKCDTGQLVIHFLFPPINNAPIGGDDRDSTIQNQIVFVGVLDNDVEPDGDPVVVKLSSGILEPMNGSIAVQPNYDIAYTPDQNFIGFDTFQYIVCDTIETIFGCDTLAGLCDTQSIIIEIVNQAPVAVFDCDTVMPGTAASLFVLSNDFDPDSNQIRLQVLGSNPGSTNQTTTSGGSVMINDNLTPGVWNDDFVDYVPPNGFFGLDSFFYVLCDIVNPTDSFLCDTGVVKILVRPSPDTVAILLGRNMTDTVCVNPQLDLGGDYFTRSICKNGSNVTASFLQNPNDSCVQLSPSLNYCGLDTICIRHCYSLSGITVCDTTTILVVVAPPTDSMSLQPGDTCLSPDIFQLMEVERSAICKQGKLIEVMTGLDSCLSLLPNPADTFGLDTVCIILCDTIFGLEVCDTTILLINVPARPKAISDFDTTDANTSVEIAVLKNDSDYDGDIDTTSLDTIIGFGPINGTLVVNFASGTITYTPDENFAGQDSFQYIICDSTPPTFGPLCDTATVYVTVTSLPILAVNDTAITPANTMVNVDVPANDKPGLVGLDTASVVIVSGEGPMQGLAAVLPDGTINYTPNEHFAGVDSFQYVICDSIMPVPNCDTATVVLVVGP